MKLYNINLFEKENYDLVVDTTAMSPEEVFEMVSE
jgi:cytidylate kinase